MRWIGGQHLAAGLAARGFFDLFQKPALNANASMLVSGSGGFLLTGFVLTNNESKGATRFNTTFLALAQLTTDTLVAGFDGHNIPNAFAVPGRFVIFDLSGHVADSTNGVTWTLGTGGVTPGESYSYIYDDLNAKIIVATGGNSVIRSANVSPLAFTTVAIPVSFAGLGYKGAGTGITLGQGGSNVYKSTDGGATWVSVGATAFATSTYIIRGQTQWLAFGDNGTSLQYSISTNDGTTWTAPTTFPGANNLSNAFCSIATDGAGNWVVIGDGLPPDNYWVSTNDGTTFTSPNLFSAQGGIPSSSSTLINSGGNWLAAWSDPTQKFMFLATSPDGKTWTKGSNIIDLP